MKLENQPFIENYAIFSCVQILLKKSPILINYLFNLDKLCLRVDPKKVLMDLKMFSAGEQVLIKLALDLWDGSGNTRILEAFNVLDEENIKNMIDAFLMAQLI